MDVFECCACGLAWKPARADQPGYFNQAYGRGSGYHSPEVRRAHAKLQLEFLSEIARPGRLLDVGAGMGFFVREAADAGWEAQGIDVSHVAVDYGQTRLGCAMQLCLLDDLPAAAQFDAVTMWDLIEHVDDPEALLSAVYSRLKPGGWAFVETGNYWSYGRILDGEDWSLFQGQHYWYFNPATLKQMVRAAGFSRVVLADRVLRPRWEPDRPTRLRFHARRGLLRPSEFAREFRAWSEIRHAQRHWSEHAHCWLIALAAQKRDDGGSSESTVA